CRPPEGSPRALSSAIAELIGRYSEITPEAEMVGYLGGYAGLLPGKSLAVTPEVRTRTNILHAHGGGAVVDRTFSIASLVNRDARQPRATAQGGRSFRSVGSSCTADERPSRATRPRSRT